jgi:hypothetical protein
MPLVSRIHSLKISGWVKEQKKFELEDTVKFACGLLSDKCVEKSLSMESLFGDQYYFFTSWSTEKALREFIESEEYQLVRSAFDALGVLQKIEIGFDNKITTILIHPL